jgi:hypothetical protein
MSTQEQRTARMKELRREAAEQNARIEGSFAERAARQGESPPIVRKEYEQVTRTSEPPAERESHDETGTTSDGTLWWRAMETHVAAAIEAAFEADREMRTEVYGAVIGEERAATNKKFAELERTLVVIREEVALEKKLAGLHSQVDRALEKQPRRERELSQLREQLAAAEKNLTTARGQISMLEYQVAELSKAQSKVKVEVSRAVTTAEHYNAATIHGVKQMLEAADLVDVWELPDGHA